MIVKDEAHHLARCLLSSKPLVDEIVVVDTGSTDRSADIARAFGAHVYHHPWRHDFSEARNVSIARASGDWIMVLDADEALSPKDFAQFRQMVAGAPTSAYTVRTRNYTNEVNTVGWQPNTGEDRPLEAGTGWFPSEKVRLFPKLPKVMFSGAVHELVEPGLRAARIPIRACELQVHHYGQLKEAQTRSKTRAYAEIEQRKLQESADRPASLREAAIQAGRLGRHAESIDLWRRFLADRPDSAEAYVNLSAACLQLGRYEEAVCQAESGLRCAPSMREAHVNLALAALHRGDAGRALTLLGSLVRREPDYLHARFLLAAVYACRGEQRQFTVTLQPITATPIGTVLSVSFQELARTLVAAGQDEYGRRLRRAAQRSEFTHSTGTRRFEDQRRDGVRA
jgi:Flp pilus assembly protein TadD